MIGATKIEKVNRTKVRKHEDDSFQLMQKKKKHHDKSFYRLMKEDEEYGYIGNNSKTNKRG